jgi:hypothetical protein
MTNSVVSLQSLVNAIDSDRATSFWSSRGCVVAKRKNNVLQVR